MVFRRKIFHFNQNFADLEGNKGSYFLDKIWQFWPLCTSFIQPRFLFRRDAKFKAIFRNRDRAGASSSLIGAYHSGCFPKLFMPHAILESDSRRLFQCNTHWEFCPKSLSNCPNQLKIFWLQIVTNMYLIYKAQTNKVEIWLYFEYNERELVHCFLTKLNSPWNDHKKSSFLMVLCLVLKVFWMLFHLGWKIVHHINKFCCFLTFQIFQTPKTS